MGKPFYGHETGPSRCLALGLLLSAILFGSLPSPAHALPVAGDYTFTSGLIGSFITDGNHITDFKVSDKLEHFAFSWNL